VVLPEEEFHFAVTSRLEMDQFSTESSAQSIGEMALGLGIPAERDARGAGAKHNTLGMTRELFQSGMEVV